MHRPPLYRPLPRPRARTAGPDGRELVSFLLVGCCAYAVDLVLFLLLRGRFGWEPLTAKTLSFLAGSTVAYLGNALGTYGGRGRARRVSWRDCAAFFGVNAAGALVQLLCLAVSHHVLGFTSARADTVSGLGVGMLLATCLRFWGTRTLVFGSTEQVGGRRRPWTG
ncbi:GtrA family protein [Streptomyces marianii]|uniref:GtrA family protein n=1 Tax=Streptomyces marianii TaxID=1817406 RepID=A0A5R9EDB0_9ACTN|nr:GtrA family protein [Streptomyces marianii]